MAAKAVTVHPAAPTIETCPAAHRRILPVRSNKPVIANGSSVHPNGTARSYFHPRSPAKRHSGVRRATGENSMQRRPADSQTWAAGKFGLGCHASSHKADSAKEKTILRSEFNSQLGKRVPSGRHDTFAARFIDRRVHGVDDCDAEAVLPRGNRRGETRGTTSDNENVC